jgi:hypothetical protein
LKEVFLSHAHADKDGCVRPFAKELDKRGISYWLDEAEIGWGDKIGARINDGLRDSRFVIVFLTENFFGRSWTETELSAALSKENSEGRIVVLPIIVGNPTQILKSYPLLNDKAYLLWSVGIETLVDHLQTRLFVATPQADISIAVGDTGNTVVIKPSSLLEFLDEMDGHGFFDQVWVCQQLRMCGFLADVKSTKGIVVNGFFIPDTAGDFGLPGTRALHLARLLYKLITTRDAQRQRLGRGSSYRTLLRDIAEGIQTVQRQAPPIPAPPNHLRAWRRDPTNVLLIWEPSQHAESYRVLLGGAPEISAMKDAGSTAEHSYSIESLEPDQEIYFAVIANNRSGASAASQFLSLSTAALGEEEWSVSREESRPTDLPFLSVHEDGWEDLGW